jgi:hypothetical protein
MSSGPEHVAVCECEWAVSTRGQGVDRQSVETVAKAHCERCGPVELRRVDDPAGKNPLAGADGETVTTFGGSA